MKIPSGKAPSSTRLSICMANGNTINAHDSRTKLKSYHGMLNVHVSIDMSGRRALIEAVSISNSFTRITPNALRVKFTESTMVHL